MAAVPAALCACVARAPRMRLWLAVPHLIGCMASPALCMLAVLAALYLIWNSTRSKFGPKESAAIAEVLNDSLSCTPR